MDSTRAVTVFAIAFATALAGCGDNARFRGDAAALDAAVARPDAAAADAGRDGAPDATVDGALADAAPDGATADASLDAAGDAGRDAGPDAALDASLDASLDAPAFDGGPSVRVRIVTANVTSGNFQAYEDPGIRILAGLHADVALVQEMNYGDNSASAIRTFVDGAFGPQFDYVRESGAQIPNGVVTRFPILESGVEPDPQVSNRSFVWARIDVPGPTDLWAVSVHFLTSSATNRDLEAKALDTWLGAHVPAADYLVIGGDFNTATRTEPCLATLATYVQTGAPFPVDQLANGNTNGPRSKPYDWVLADPDLDAHRVTVDIGASHYPDGLVFDTRVYTPIDEVAPALATDSAATSMQHMAVVKDFQLPQ